MIKLSDYVFNFVAEKGVKDVFLLPGGGCMHLVDSLGSNPNLAYTAMLHEQAVAVAADAYAQYTNNLGVALVTTGPGGTNAITGVAGSWLDSIPVMIISGQVKRPDITGEKGIRQFGFQEIDIVSIVKPITKYAVTVMDPESIAFELEKAYFLASTGRKGPVWIDIPLDVQAMMIDETDLVHFTPPFPVTDPLDISPVTQLLKKAKRPVILAGNGVRLASAESLFNNLIRMLKIPVLTSWKAADLLGETDELFAGRPGSIGQRGANYCLQTADLLISIGARLDFGQIGYEHHLVAPKAQKIIVDIDEAEIDKLGFPVDVKIIADAGRFITELDADLGKLNAPPEWKPWLARCKAWQQKYDPISQGRSDFPGFVDEYAFFDELSDQLTDSDVIIPGSSGACSEVTMQTLRVKKGQRIFNTQGLGPMGFALPATIGGCIASGFSRVISIDGDGGFFMNIQELETIKRLNLPIKYFVLNNAGYGSIRFTQQNYFNSRFVACNDQSGLTLPNIQAVGQSYGIKTEKIWTNAELPGKLREILAIDGPVLCELNISPEQFSKPRLSSRQLPDGSFVSSPLEDLMPFLDRTEFESNMQVDE